MTTLSTIKRVILAGVVAVSMMATSLTAFAADEDSVTKASTGDAKAITLDVNQTFTVTGGSMDNKTVHYTLTPDTESHEATTGYTSNTEQALKDGDISFQIGDGTKNDGEFSIDGDNTKAVITFTPNTPGLYVFTLATNTNKTPDQTPYVYDRSEYRVRVYVRNTGKNFVTVAPIVGDEEGEKVSKVVYDHYYSPIITDDPPVLKHLEGDTPSLGDAFHFQMTVVSPDDAPLPKNATATITVDDVLNGTGEAEIGTIEFDKVGTYVYKVTETKEDVKGYTYDETVYTVTYVVTADKTTNALTSTRTIEMDGEAIENPTKEFKYEFTNSYKKSGGKGDDGDHHDGGGSGSLMVYKVDAASDNLRLAGVTFEVTKTNGDYVTTITTDDKGMAAIDNLPAGTYRLKETNIPAGYQSENRYIYVNVIKGTTVASPTNVKVTNTKAVEVQHIVAIKQWANVDGIDTPDSIVFELYKDGAATGVTQVVSAANNWTVDFGLIPADGNYEIVETSVPENYAVSTQKTVNGTDVVYTITNTYTGAAASHQNAYTGDSSNMMIYAGIMGVAIIALAGWFVVERRSR